MRKLVQDGELPRKTVELIFTILDSLGDEVSGAKAHAQWRQLKQDYL